MARKKSNRKHKKKTSDQNFSEQVMTSNPSYSPSRNTKLMILFSLTTLSIISALSDVAAGATLGMTLLLVSTVAAQGAPSNIINDSAEHEIQMTTDPMESLPLASQDERTREFASRLFSEEDNDNIKCSKKSTGTTVGKVCTFFGNKFWLKEHTINAHEQTINKNKVDQEKLKRGKMTIEDLHKANKKSNGLLAIDNFEFIKLVAPNVKTPKTMFLQETNKANNGKLYFATADIPNFTNTKAVIQNPKFKKMNVSERINELYASVYERIGNNIANLCYISLFVGDLSSNPDNWGDDGKGNLVIVDADFPLVTFGDYFKNAIENFNPRFPAMGVIISLNDLKIIKEKAESSPKKPAYLTHDAYSLLLKIYTSAAEATINKFRDLDPETSMSPNLDIQFSFAAELEKLKVQYADIMDRKVKDYQDQVKPTLGKKKVTAQ